MPWLARVRAPDLLALYRSAEVLRELRVGTGPQGHVRVKPEALERIRQRMLNQASSSPRASSGSGPSRGP